MENKLVTVLLTLNRINAKLKSLSQELDKIGSVLADEEFLQLFDNPKTSTLSNEDYD